jgi:hypothetical protein
MRRRRETTDPNRFAGGRGDVIERKDGDEVDARIDQLTRELAEAINEAEAEGRVVMRDYAIDLLRDEVETQASPPGDGTKGRSAAPLNPFAFGIPVLLIGVVLAFIFTPVGVALLLLGTLICVAGVVMAVARSARDRWWPGSAGQ